jgi:hypothetical protein
MSVCNLQKSTSTSSADWSTSSPNNVVGEYFDIAVDKMSSNYIVSDMLVDIDSQESIEDPLEWLVDDLDTQQYLPESSLPMFPDFAEQPVSESSQSYLVEDALLNNMIDPGITLQTLFSDNDGFLDDLL